MIHGAGILEDRLLAHKTRESFDRVFDPATTDEFLLLNKTGATKLPNPPQMNNHGNFIVSLGAMCAAGMQAEALGVEIYPGYAASEILFDEAGHVAGVRIGDMGIAKDGSHKDSYTQGIDIKAKLTVLGEGARGHYRNNW